MDPGAFEDLRKNCCQHYYNYYIIFDAITVFKQKHYSVVKYTG